MRIREKDKDKGAIKVYQTSEHRITAATLALVGGFLDVYTFLCRGYVFANAQTGNIVLMAAALATLDFNRVLTYFAPVMSFVLGIIICEIIKDRIKSRIDIKTHWRQIIIAIEIIALAAVAFIPIGSGNFVANIIVSFVCAMQMEAFRKVQGITYVSTMCTGNLRSATACIYTWKKTGDKKILENGLRYFKVILWFVIGAAAGALLVPLIGEKAVLVAAALLVGILLLMRKEYIS